MTTPDEIPQNDPVGVVCPGGTTVSIASCVVVIHCVICDKVARELPWGTAVTGPMVFCPECLAGIKWAAEQAARNVCPFTRGQRVVVTGRLPYTDIDVKDAHGRIEVIGHDSNGRVLLDVRLDQQIHGANDWGVWPEQCMPETPKETP